MKNLMNLATRVSMVVLATGMFVVALAPCAEAQQLSINAVEVAISAPQDGVAQATFRISVTSSEQSALMSFTVAYKDGTKVELGDVPAQGSLVSALQTKYIDASTPSASIPIPVTLTYTVNGNAVEIPWAIVLTRP
jgi:hypothetical protein